MIDHISTYENLKTHDYIYVLFNNESGEAITIEGDSITYTADWEAPPDIDLLNDPIYELVYIDSSSIEGISNEYKEELTPEAHTKICKYLLEELKKKK